MERFVPENVPLGAWDQYRDNRANLPSGQSPGLTGPGVQVDAPSSSESDDIPDGNVQGNQAPGSQSRGKPTNVRKRGPIVTVADVPRRGRQPRVRARRAREGRPRDRGAFVPPPGGFNFSRARHPQVGIRHPPDALDHARGTRKAPPAVGKAPSAATSGASMEESPNATVTDEAIRDEELALEEVDYRTPFQYQGIQQPSVGDRLDHCINYLCDEDVDRTMNWKLYIKEIRDFLDWIRTEYVKNEKRSLRLLRNLAKAEQMYSMHQDFEKWHYGKTPFAYTQTNKPLASGRLNGVAGPEKPSIAYTPAPRPSSLLPEASTLRPFTQINGMTMDHPDDKPAKDAAAGQPAATEEIIQAYDTEYWKIRKLRRALMLDENDFWRAREPNFDMANLFVVEQRMYTDLVTRGGGWFFFNDLGQKFVQRGSRVMIRTDTRVGFAQERGARRAGIQTLMRHFSVPDAITMGLDHEPRIVLPADWRDIERVQKATEGRQDMLTKTIDATKLDIPGLESHRFSIAWRDYLKNFQLVRDQVRLELTAAHGTEADWFLLPTNPVGPYLWRGRLAVISRKEDLLRACLEAKQALDSALIHSGPHLQPLVDLVTEGMHRKYRNGANPDDDLPVLRRDEWVMARTGPVRVLAYTTWEELKWLRFLAATPSSTWQALAPLTPRAAMFLLFADRLMMLMGDTSPECLFPAHDTQVDVETIVNRMKAQSAGAWQVCTQFNVYDAMQWCDRLHQQGRIIFRECPEAYGWIRRPAADMFPDDLVKWHHNDKNTKAAILPRYPDDTWTYDQLFDPKTNSFYSGMDDDDVPRRREFLEGIAFRLGRTIDALQVERNAIWNKAQTACKGAFGTKLTQWHDAVAPFIVRDGEDTPAAPAAHAWTHPHSIIIKQLNPLLYDRSGGPDMCLGAALGHIRGAIIDELEANASLLWPARTRTRQVAMRCSRTGRRWTETRTDAVWDWDWSWGGADARGARRQYFSLERWLPGWQPAGARRDMAEDVGADAYQAWDAAADDPTDPKWFRTKLRRFGEERVEFRQGPPVFPVGDTPRQRRMVEGHITDMAHRAMGLDRPRTWKQRLSDFFTGAGRAVVVPAAEDTAENLLPRIDDSAAPRSWDPPTVDPARAAALHTQQHDVDDDGGRWGDDDDHHAHDVTRRRGGRRLNENDFRDYFVPQTDPMDLDF